MAETLTLERKVNRLVEPFRTINGKVAKEGSVVAYHINGIHGNFSGIVGKVGKDYVEILCVLDSHVFPVGTVTYAKRDLINLSFSDYSLTIDSDLTIDFDLTIQEYKKKYERAKTK